jgi:SEC-C motif domain protein
MAEKSQGLSAPQPGQPCPCGSGRFFDDCCEPLLAGRRRPATAEELMRSRFTAHVARDDAYLHRTHQPTAKLPFKAPAGAADTEPLKWSRLKVHAHELGTQPDTAFVDFSAYFVEEDGEHVIQEKSEFHRVDGQWLYSRAVRMGPAPIKSALPKIGRNDPCPCGSGKKYKQCCLGKA